MTKKCKTLLRLAMALCRERVSYRYVLDAEYVRLYFDNEVCDGLYSVLIPGDFHLGNRNIEAMQEEAARRMLYLLLDLTRDNKAPDMEKSRTRQSVKTDLPENDAELLLRRCLTYLHFCKSEHAESDPSIANRLILKIKKYFKEG